MCEEDSAEEIVVEVDAGIADLVPGYLANRRRDVTRIREALQRLDYASARTLGHRMKGTGGGYGLARISEPGAAIETASKFGDPVALEEAVAALDDFLARVRVTEG